MHTLVAEEIPCDPDWFYLVPVHCTFWTNSAMKIFFERYGFIACSYNVDAQTWLMFRDKDPFEKLKSIAPNLSGKWIFSDSFVDYWKVKPYRN